ncbi:cytosolic sulfotransferase 17-like [Triticum dicoccoides]|uniref:cytosolic sulfotransferase 17-like n=1 Tax=Triticum dicoccoides TaxID=85692 RepID=UPI001891934D|nr:cytosolic sulfotransferase 17-like [Triticum dicoccoides]
MAQPPSKGEDGGAAMSSAQSKSISPKDLISTLPTSSDDRCSGPLVLYKNYWLRFTVLERILLAQVTMKPRDDDIILATQPKSGTTWLKALAFAITNRGRYGFGDHPLLTQHPQHLVPSIELHGPGRDHTDLNALASPRLLSTHIPMSLLPPEMTPSSGRRVVYLCRDPKDKFVSRWHFDNKIFHGSAMELDKAYDLFCRGLSPYGPFWEHYLEYWKASLATPDKVLFLKYEEIKEDSVGVVRKLAVFLGVPFSQEEESSRVPEEVARVCSFETLRSLQVNQVSVVNEHGNHRFPANSAFFRKGQVGDWANHMSREMGEKMDQITKEKLKGSGLAF